MTTHANERILLTYREAANALGIGRNTLYAMIRRGDIAVIRCGPRATRISREALSLWVTKMAQATEDSAADVSLYQS